MLTASFLLLTGAASRLGAQSELPGVFGEVLDVRVVDVEVVVTGPDGNRVRGLNREDFRLVVDGEETSIDYFTEVRGGVSVEEGAGPGPDDGFRPGEPVGTSYLIFIDDFFSVARDRNEVLDSLEKQVGGLRPNDRMAVVAFDGNELEMLTTWTRNPAALERALKEARRRTSYGLQRLAERRQGADRDLGRGFGRTPSVGRRDLGIDEEHYARLLQEQIQRSVIAASATLRAFASPPGRKVMVLLSGGWPFRPADYVAGEFARGTLEVDVEGGEELLRPLTDTANLLGYTLYPVDVPGLVSTGPDASQAVPREIDYSFRERETHSTLSFLAERTGGRAMLDSRRMSAMEEVVRDTRTYYSLGFTLDREGDDRHHDIRVELRNPRLRARYRDGFGDFSRRTEVTMAMESGLLFGNAPSTGRLGLRLGEPVRAGFRRVELPIAVAIPLERLTFVPVGDELVAEVELRLAVRDENGDTAPIPVIPLTLRRQERPEEGDVEAFRTSLKLRRVDHELVVSIFEPVSESLLSARAEIDL
ncbi:MAG: VWA domain-containing protein [Thermoanaerobaculia bacterium]|nr:VWA domain-containing protein [Thermoanaerobaculia bacterium]